MSGRRDGVALGAVLREALDNSFGYLSKEGFCMPPGEKGGKGKACHTFPVAIGEFGSRFTDKEVGRVWTACGSRLPIGVAPAARDGVRIHPVLLARQDASGARTHAHTRTRTPCLDRYQDLEHLKDFTMYLRNEGPGNTGRHQPIRNYFYWCYNAVGGWPGLTCCKTVACRGAHAAKQ